MITNSLLVFTATVRTSRITSLPVSKVYALVNDTRSAWATQLVVTVPVAGNQHFYSGALVYDDAMFAPQLVVTVPVTRIIGLTGQGGEVSTSLFVHNRVDLPDVALDGNVSEPCVATGGPTTTYYWG